MNRALLHLSDFCYPLIQSLPFWKRKRCEICDSLMPSLTEPGENVQWLFVGPTVYRGALSQVLPIKYEVK